MRAHFASDVPVSADSDNEKKSPPSPSSQYQNGTIGEDGWQSRIGEFKMNSIQMAVVYEFIDDILQRAKKETLRQRSAQYNKNILQGKIESHKQSYTDFNGGKVGNMARVFVVRVFDAICNCANNAASAPMPRLKFRGSKRTSTTGSTPFGFVANEKDDNNGNKTTKTSKKSASAKNVDAIICKVDVDVSAQEVTKLS